MYFNFKARKNNFVLLYYSSVKYIFFNLFLMFFVNHTYTMHRQFNIAIWFQQAYTSQLPKSMRLLLDQKRHFTIPLSPRKKNYEKNILQEIYNTLFLNIVKPVAFDLTNNNNIAKPESQDNETPTAPPSANNEELDTKNGQPHKLNDKDEKDKVKSTQQDTVLLANESNNQYAANKTPLPATTIVPLNDQIIPMATDKNVPILYPRHLKCATPLCIFLKEKYKLTDYMYNMITILNLRPIYSVILCQWYHTILTSEIPYPNRNEGLKLSIELLDKIFCFMSNHPHETKAKQDFTNYYLDETSGEALSNAYVEIPGKCIVKPQGCNLMITPIDVQEPKDLVIYAQDVLDHLKKYQYIASTISYCWMEQNYNAAKDKTDLCHLIIKSKDPNTKNDPRLFPLCPPLECFYHSGRLSSKYPIFKNNVTSEQLKQSNAVDRDQRVTSNKNSPEQNESSCTLRSQCVVNNTLTVKEFFTNEHIIGGGDLNNQAHSSTKPPASSHVVQVTKGTELIKEIVLPVFTTDETRYTLLAPFQLARYHFVGVYPYLPVENHDNSIIIFYDTKTGKYPCVPLMSDCFNANNISQENFFYHQDRHITAQTKGIRSMLFDHNRETFLKEEYKSTQNYYLPNNTDQQPNYSVLNLIAQGTRQLQSALETIYDAFHR